MDIDGYAALVGSGLMLGIGALLVLVGLAIRKFVKTE